MQNHDMKLNESPFEKIKQGIKDVEYRLNDEKRRQIKIGDTITFTKISPEEETIKVLVTDLKYYKTLLEMYKDTFDRYLKDYYTTPDEVVKDTTYYTDEQVEKYGCIAIFIKKL